MSDCLCIGQWRQGNHILVKGGSFRFLCSQVRKETSQPSVTTSEMRTFICGVFIDELNMRFMSFVVFFFFCGFYSDLLPEVANLERGLNPARGPHVPVSVTVSWNTLESAHLNHTERTTETKKRSYIKTVKSKNRRYRIYSTAHHLCSSPPSFFFFFFFFIPVQHLRSLFLPPSNCLSLHLLVLLLPASRPSNTPTQSLYSWLSGDHRNS